MRMISGIFLAATSFFSLYYVLPYCLAKMYQIRLRKKMYHRKMLVLTFDDGPGSRLTPQILNLLNEHKAKATFFLLGKNIISREKIVRDIMQQEHEICSHGYAHRHGWKEWPWKTIQDIKAGYKAIEKVCGETLRACPFRPPYGKLNIVSLLYLYINKIPIYYWSLVSGDTWKTKEDADEITSTVKQQGGAIVLFHDFDRKSPENEQWALNSVKELLEMAKANNFHIVTMTQFLSNGGSRR